tara:strand:- start:69 stop:797 length:729 start_codon:yes stop_codon:yes gene_type:complete
MKKLLCILALMILPISSHSVDKINLGKNFYVGLGGGVISPNDVDSKSLSTSGTAFDGATYTASAANGLFKISFDSGYQISGLLGYRVLDWLGLEAELSYTNFDYDKLTIGNGANITVTRGSTTNTYNANASIDIDGDVSSFSMIFGPVFDYDLSSNFEVFAGGGIGFASYEEEVKSLNSDTGYANTYEATEFASKVKAGFNYFVNDMAHVQFEYGYNYVDSENEIFESFDAHSYIGRVVFNF